MSSEKTNKVKLTKRVVESALPDPLKRIVLWDTEITGLCVRIYPSGKKTYFLQYRNKDRETHKVKIGVHGTITTELAREQAVKLSLNISIGEDPSVKIVSENKAQSMQGLAEQYLSLHAKLKKAPKGSKRLQRRFSYFKRYHFEKVWPLESGCNLNFRFTKATF